MAIVCAPARWATIVTTKVRCPNVRGDGNLSVPTAGFPTLVRSLTCVLPSSESLTFARRFAAAATTRRDVEPGQARTTRAPDGGADFQ